MIWGTVVVMINSLMIKVAFALLLGAVFNIPAFLVF